MHKDRQPLVPAMEVLYGKGGNVYCHWGTHLQEEETTCSPHHAVDILYPGKPITEWIKRRLGILTLTSVRFKQPPQNTEHCVELVDGTHYGWSEKVGMDESYWLNILGHEGHEDRFIYRGFSAERPSDIIRITTDPGRRIQNVNQLKTPERTRVSRSLINLIEIIENQ